MSDDHDSLPVIDRAAVEAVRDDDTSATTSVAGVLLAAGRSERFGEGNKLLAELDGEPLVRHAARTLVGASLDRVVAVVGHESDRVRAALADLPVAVVTNPDYEAGQATSVRRGIEATREDGAEAEHPVPDAAVFALGDMPAVATETVELLVAAFRADLGDPLAAAHEGRRGNPALFGAGHFDALAAVDGDTGGRELLRSAPGAALVETGDPGVREDVDTPADLERLRNRRR
jgi:molybdenum cofactor cytidylyltransferase